MSIIDGNISGLPISWESGFSLTIICMVITMVILQDYKQVGNLGYHQQLYFVIIINGDILGVLTSWEI